VSRPAPAPNRIRVNGSIPHKHVRVIAPDGSQAGVLDIGEARRRAEAAELDLVEVAPNADPPVCKIMDYAKARFEAERVERDQKRKAHAAAVVKEIQLSTVIEEHDIKIKAAQADKFLAKHNRVRVVVTLKGRTINRPEQADAVLEKFFAQLTEAHTQEDPSRSGRRVTVLLRP